MEFETDEHEHAASYDRWFRLQVQTSLDDDSPEIPHDQVMAEMQVIIDEASERLHKIIL